MKNLFLTLLGLIISINSIAYDFQLDGIYYTIISESDCIVEVSRNNDEYYSGNLTIPSQVTKYGQTYTVKRIGQNAFMDCKNLYSVTIPETVDSINSGAFAYLPVCARLYPGWHCTLTSIVPISSCGTKLVLVVAIIRTNRTMESGNESMTSLWCFTDFSIECI